MKLLLVEDEKNLNNVLTSYLEHDGYEVQSLYNGKSALEILASNDYDAYIFDIMLGDISGYDLLEELKNRNIDKPVIFISARDSDIDKILGLEYGCADYITKPFNPKELVLRLNNILNRVINNSKENIKSYEDYKINMDKRLVFIDDEKVKLTTREYDLLLILLNNTNYAFSREELLTKLWGESYFGSDRVVDDLVRRLRAKMPLLNLETIYGYGYRLI